VMTDLNSLVPVNSPLYLLHGYGINSAGQIVGFGVTSDGEIHGFLATPLSIEGGPANDSPVAQAGAGVRAKVTLSENARKQLQQWLRVRRFAASATNPNSLPSR
jgi:probable HAF family extracellular repeat protein